MRCSTGHNPKVIFLMQQLFDPSHAFERFVVRVVLFEGRGVKLTSELLLDSPQQSVGVFPHLSQVSRKILITIWKEISTIRFGPSRHS